MSQLKHYYNEHFDQESMTQDSYIDCHFHHCWFDKLDLSDTQFIRCHFYDKDTEQHCSFKRAKLSNASFIECDISMVDFSYIDALGLTLHKCRAVGSNFHRASFSNQVTVKVYFCAAYFTENLFSYVNFTGVILEKCELQDNRWQGGNLKGLSLAGSDLSRGEFSEFDWHDVNIRECNLTDAELIGLDIRQHDVTGVTISQWQQAALLELIGININ